MSRRILLASLAIWSGLAFAQIRSGSITGRVVDPSGAPVPNAQVTVLTQGTNVQIQTLTNSVGEYTVPYLASGQYTLRVTANGFVTAQAKDLNLGSAQTLRADIKLE